jgi:hypothetical protein
MRLAKSLSSCVPCCTSNDHLHHRSRTPPEIARNAIKRKFPEKCSQKMARVTRAGQIISCAALSYPVGSAPVLGVMVQDREKKRADNTGCAHQSNGRSYVHCDPSVDTRERKIVKTGARAYMHRNAVCPAVAARQKGLYHVHWYSLEKVQREKRGKM